MLQKTDFAAWPGASWVSGNITGTASYGSSALGTVTTFAPGVPTTLATIAADTRVLACEGYDAIEVIASVGGTGILFDNFSLGLAFCLYDTMADGFRPRVSLFTGESSGSTTLQSVDSASTTLAASGKIHDTLASGTGSEAPLLFPEANIARNQANFSATGTIAAAHYAQLSAGACSTLLIPLMGASKITYRVAGTAGTGTGGCAVKGTSSNITGISIALAYRLLRIVNSSIGEVNQAN